ncbi:hypothetical protein ACROYT_G039311 [Oculina patagonica]
MSLQNTLQTMMKMLRESADREAEWEKRADHWHEAYARVNHDYLALKYDAECEDCIRERQETPEGKTLVLCKECSDKCTSRSDLKRRIDKLEEEVRYWQGCEITDNALLNKAARIAAESHLLLKDKSVPDGIAVARVKPLARERARLTKRIRQFPMGGVTARRPGEEAEEEEEEELENVGLVTGPVETMLKQLIKGSAKKSPPTVTPKATKKAKSAPAGKPTLAERFKSLEEKLKTRKKPAVRKTEAEKLKPLPGWEDWAKGKKLRRKLEYDEDQEEED